MKTIHDETVQLSTTKKEDWMLIWNEELQKFEAKWFESYKILKTHSLETYALEMLTECVLWNLIYNNWLVKAHIFDADEFWASSELQSSLKWAKLSVQWLSLKVDEILKQKESLLSFYEELLIISWVKWDCRQKKGLHKLLVEKKEDLSQKAIYKTWKCYEWVNLSVFSLQNILKAHWSVASFKLILTEVNDVMNASQKTIESQRNTDDLTLTFMTEKRCN